MHRILAVIPLYNKEQTISRALNSILEQNKKVDILIVNDGSTDGSIAQIQPMLTPNITVINQANAGVSAARNTGIDFALENNYTHIAILDADDHWKPNHINHLTLLIERYESAHVFATGYEIKQFKFKAQTAVFSNLDTSNPRVLKNFFECNYLNSILNASNSCFNLDIFKSIGLFNTSFSHGEDTDLFIRIGIHYNVAFHPAVSVKVDRTAGNRSEAIPMKNRRLFELDDYEVYTDKIVGLKKYLDLNRFSISLAYRLENDIKNATIYKLKLDPQNLSTKQNKLLEMSTMQLKALKKTKNILGNLGWYLRSAD